MGTPTKSQRRGKGGSTFNASTHKSEGSIQTPENGSNAVVEEILHDPARTAPVAKIRMEDGAHRKILAPENMYEGQEIQIGVSAEIEPGNTLPLKEIPEGVPVHNIEIRPNEGGKMVRGSGTYAFVVTHDKNEVVIKLPSDQFKTINNDCRASIGKVAAGGRKDKPLVKAGNAHHLAKARGKDYPNVRGVAMNAVDHPFGGSASPGQPKTVSSDASPGSKSGSVSAETTGAGEKQ